MALLNKVTPNGPSLLIEIEEFREFLKCNPRGEREHFLPFFAKHNQLCSFLATLNDRVSVGTHLKVELPLWGDFICDLAVGNLDDSAFVLVEFEGAAETSLFRPKPNRKNNIWGQRVEQAVSQLTDWLFRLNSEGSSDQMERDFGSRRIKTSLHMIGCVWTGDLKILLLEDRNYRLLRMTIC
jgi:hypothetical protein